MISHTTYKTSSHQLATMDSSLCIIKTHTDILLTENTTFLYYTVFQFKKTQHDVGSTIPEIIVQNNNRKPKKKKNSLM